MVIFNSYVSHYQRVLRGLLGEKQRPRFWKTQTPPIELIHGVHTSPEEMGCSPNFGDFGWKKNLKKKNK